MIFSGSFGQTTESMLRHRSVRRRSTTMTLPPHAVRPPHPFAAGVRPRRPLDGAVLRGCPTPPSADLLFPTPPSARSTRSARISDPAVSLTEGIVFHSACVTKCTRKWCQSQF
jgi:hypothetical protein